MEKGSSSTPSPPTPHVLIFPFPALGHVNAMLKLAEILTLWGLRITFLNTEHIHERLLQSNDIQSRLKQTYHGRFNFKTIPDGLPVDHLRLNGSLKDMFEAMDLQTKPMFKEMLLSEQRVDCIIGDGILGFVLDVGLEVGIPVIHFRTISPCSFWAYFCTPDVIKAGELPIKGNEDMDRLITKVPGMEELLRCRDLPSFFRVSDVESPFLQMITDQTRRSSKAHSLILNTFEELDAPILAQVRTHCPRTYAVGPLNELLKATTTLQTQETRQLHSLSNGLWKVDRSCLEWLDRQLPQSVVYVSFGSITLMTKDQLLEFWHGLVNSKKRFLWVRRPSSIVDCDTDGDLAEIPEELLEGIKERGKIVEWAPQEEVLAHKAIGGFLTHSGWNSTLESIVAGVPMICWPYFADQQINSRFVSEVWKLGLEMKDVCDRVVVEKMVNDLMVERRDEFIKSASRMAELARKSVRVGGTSFNNLELLIENIRSISVQTDRDG